jgi:hypothetical protein
MGEPVGRGDGRAVHESQVSRRTRDEFLVPVRVVELAKLDVLGRDLIEVRGAHFGPGRRDEPKI